MRYSLPAYKKGGHSVRPYGLLISASTQALTLASALGDFGGILPPPKARCGATPPAPMADTCRPGHGLDTLFINPGSLRHYNYLSPEIVAITPKCRYRIFSLRYRQRPRFPFPKPGNPSQANAAPFTSSAAESWSLNAFMASSIFSPATCLRAAASSSCTCSAFCGTSSKADLSTPAVCFEHLEAPGNQFIRATPGHSLDAAHTCRCRTLGNDQEGATSEVRCKCVPPHSS